MPFASAVYASEQAALFIEGLADWFRAAARNARQEAT